MPVQYSARLSIADQFAPVSHTNVTIPIPTKEPRKVYERLSDGFRRYCRQLPYLTGRISRGNQRGFTIIRWSDYGEFKLEEKHPQGLPSYESLLARKMPLHEVDHDFRPSGIITREYVEQPGDEWPAMMACVTFLDGGVVLGCSYHHHLVDGMATQVLIHRLAVVTSGHLDAVDAELDSLSPLRRFAQINKALDIETTETGLVEEPISDAPQPALAPPPVPAAVSTSKEVELEVKIFTLRLSAIEVLRASLRESLREDFGGRRPPTSAVLASLMWCIINQSRERRRTTSKVEGKEPASTLIMPAPATQLFDKGGVVHSRNFIGNLVTAAAISDEVSVLGGNTDDPAYRGLPDDFPEIVKRLTTSLMMAMNPEFIKGRLQQIMDLPDVRALSSASTLSSNDMLCTSWGSMSFQGTFGEGVGVPEFVRPATDPPSMRKTNRAFYQYVVILPKDMHGRADSAGTIELFVCLEKGDMAEVEQHPVLVKLQREPVKL